MINDGWIDWAERRDGHPAKVYSQPNAGEGIACHSIVGNLPNHSVPSRFLADDRVPGQPGRFTDEVAASVMFILYRDGHLIQMYPVTASTWTSGGFEGNTRFWAIEAEGGYNPTTEPLTKEAEDTFIRLVSEWESYTGYKAVPGSNILQHKDIAALFGYAATSCASDRYSNAWARIAAGERYGDELSAEDKERLARLERIVAGNHLTTEVWEGNVADLQAVGISNPIIGTTIGLTGEAALAYADRRGFSFALGVKLAQDAAAEAKQLATQGVPIAEHDHVLPEGRTSGAKFT